MPLKKGLHFPIASFVILGVSLIISYLLFNRFFDVDTFPDLPAGSYIGTIKGITNEGHDDKLTLYVERIQGVNLLLFLLFKSDWEPQVIPLIKTSSNESMPESDSLKFFAPLIVRDTNKSFVLTGSINGLEYSGKVKLSGDVVGEWKLKQVSTNELLRTNIEYNKNFSLTEWLKYKGKYRILSRNLDALKKNVEEKTGRFETLSKSLTNEVDLKEKSEKHKVKLTNEVEETSIEYREQKEDIKDLVQELQQLSRITRRGRAVELARRAAKREQKWYFANWEQGGSNAFEIEQNMANSMNVDLQKLGVMVKRAHEIQDLKNAVDKEQAEVLRLQEMLKQKSSSKEIPKEKEDPWWKRWSFL